MRLDKLDAALKAVAPVLGVSIGRKDDPKTWRIDFAEGATKEEKVAAQAVLAAFDPDAPENQLQPVVDRLAAVEAAIAVLIDNGILSKEAISSKADAVASLDTAAEIKR